MNVRCPECFYATLCKKTELEGLKCSNCQFDLESYYFVGKDESTQKAFLESENKRLKALKSKEERAQRQPTKQNKSEGLGFSGWWIVANTLFAILMYFDPEQGTGGGLAVSLTWFAVTVLPVWLLKSLLSSRKKKKIEREFIDKEAWARTEAIKANNSVMESVRDSAQALLDEHASTGKPNFETELRSMFSRVNQEILEEIDLLKEIQERHPKISDFVETRTTADANKKVLKDLQKYFAS